MQRAFSRNRRGLLSGSGLHSPARCCKLVNDQRLDGLVWKRVSGRVRQREAEAAWQPACTGVAEFG